MKICIQEVLPDNSIKFSTEFGSAVAFWEGDKLEMDCCCHVEVDINDTLVWDKDITQNTDNGDFTIREENHYICITGDLESVDDDGYSILRFGESIIPFMATGEHFQIGTGIKIITKSISLSPVTY